MDRFLRYDPSELRSVGAAILEALSGLDRASATTTDPEVWDELVLDWLAASASERARVDAKPARTFLTGALYEEVDWPAPRAVSRTGPVSLTHLSHPRFEEVGHPFGYAYWSAAVESERLETFLAAQLEWGGGGRAAARFGRVMLAAADLTSVDARAKVVVFATDAESERRRMVGELGRVRLAAWDTRPWLWLDFPWRVDRAEHPPAFGLFEG